MKTIEEAAKEYAKNQSILQHTFVDEVDKRKAEHACYKTALQMAEFVQRFIPIEEKLPPFKIQVLTKSIIDGKVLYDTHSFFPDEQTRKDQLKMFNVTHWRPIFVL